MDMQPVTKQQFDELSAQVTWQTEYETKVFRAFNEKLKSLADEVADAVSHKADA